MNYQIPGKKELIMKSGLVELGDGFGGFHDGVLSEVGREQQLDGGLDVVGAEGFLLVVSDQLASLQGDSLEHVGDEGVEDVHSLSGNSNVVGDALEDLENVERETLEVLFLVFLSDYFSGHLLLPPGKKGYLYPKIAI